MTLLSMSSSNVARQRQERLRLVASSVREGIEKMAELVAEAKASNDHEALGYRSWTEYLADTLGAEPMRLTRDERREVVGLLAGEGMTPTAIAPIVGVATSTVQVDERHLAEIGNVTPPRTRTGLDGKAYKRATPKPKAARAAPRRALTDQFFDAAHDMCRAVEKVHQFVDDDRWTNNKAQIASKHEVDLRHAEDLLAEVIRAVHSND